MCGVVGYLLTSDRVGNVEPLVAALRAMKHRGPDDEGLTLIDPLSGRATDFIGDSSASGVAVSQHVGEARETRHRLALGHRRFSLVDLGPLAHQPFWTEDRSVCVAFNGEIYNYVELRSELEGEGFRFRTTSDTEVLAVAYQAWGVDCFSRFNGFWALTLYDAKRRSLLLARDRLGKAPLYFTSIGGNLYWASEIKGLVALVGGSMFTVSEQAVIDFVTWRRRDLFHKTFYNEIDSFPRAAYAWVKPDGSFEAVEFWRLPEQRLSPRAISTFEASERLRELVTDATRLRLRADVPVSVQVSGGMDSSSLLAIAAGIAPGVAAYTVTFPGAEVDEEPFARAVAERCGESVEYHVLDPPADDLLRRADEYVHLMGEPFHSPNQFTNHQIWSTMTAHGIRAVLYGAGGDELFAGYRGRYFQPYLSHLLKSGHPLRCLREFFACSELQPGEFGFDYLRRARQLLRRHRLYPVPTELDPFRAPTEATARAGPSNDIRQLMTDLMTDWQMNYWLRIDNQNSMGVPLELRLPLLDFRVVEFAFELPLDYLMRDGWMKWVLRNAMEDLLPPSVTWRRKKAGFPFPLRSWLERYEERLAELLEGLDCPYIDMNAWHLGFSDLAQRSPDHLWCVTSLGLWWKRCVQGEQLC